MLVELNLRKTPSAFEYAAEAERLINLGEYSSAAEKCSEGLGKYPNDPDLYLKKAQAYLLAGDEEKALGTIEFGCKQTGSEALAEYREENFPAAVSSHEFFEVTGSGAFSAPEGGEQSDGVKDPQHKTDYTVPYPDEDEVIVRIPSVSPKPEIPQKNDEKLEKTSSESENYQ